jgi:hypothetical protein
MRLHDYIRSTARTPFALGQHDCATFATGWVLAATGRDISQGLAGRYRTYAGGLRQVRKLGYEDHVALIAAHLLERASLVDAVIGDIVVVQGEDGLALGICAGDHAQVLTERGVGAVDMAQVLRAFEVR